jgi:diguanylate cyclase (GGDEF)-like protein
VAAWDDMSAIEAPGWLQRRPTLLACVSIAIAAGIFALDVRGHRAVDEAAGTAVELHLEVLYAVPILWSLWLGTRRFTIGFTVGCSILTMVALFFRGEADQWFAVTSRFAIVLTIAVVSSLGLMRLRLEREIRYVRKVALTTLRSLGEAVITIGNQGNVRFVNRVAERLVGRPREELIGRPGSEVFVVRDRPPERPPIVELGGFGLGDGLGLGDGRGLGDLREARLMAFDGRRIPIEYTRTPIETAEGERFGEVIVFRDITARREHEEAIKRLAYRDDLTGLPNRTSLLDRFQLELAHAKRNREKLGVLYADLDGFKDVNDRHGHEAGDELLRRVAQRMRSTLRGGDTVARLGGDEFVVLLPGVTSEADARGVASKLVAALEEPVDLASGPASVSASVGIALFPRDGDEAETLLRRADKAMYRAKSLGRGRVETVKASDAR